MFYRCFSYVVSIQPVDNNIRESYGLDLSEGLKELWSENIQKKIGI